jgi:hypothetical protein
MMLSVFLSDFARATSSANDVMPDDGKTRMTFGDAPSSVIGMKSRKGS